MTISLADYTTLRVGGPAREIINVTSEAEFVATIRAADSQRLPLLVLGGGSNVLIGDEGFAGVVVRDARAEISVEEECDCSGATVTMTAGQPWDEAVATAVTRGWVGLEVLSGIPGLVGAAPVQNIGAYGSEVGNTIAGVRVYDRVEQRIRYLANAELSFGYRDSILKRSSNWGPSPRYIVLAVTFQFRLGDLSVPLRFGELTRHLEVAQGGRAPAWQVREAVLAIRASKGMVLAEDDHDTWSAGSFFTNPILTAAVAQGLPAAAPRFDTGNGLVKTSAAWLIEHAGFHKGYAMPGPAALSTKHVLALTNRGGASSAQIVTLARTVRDGVQEYFGVTLVPEPVFVGVTL